MSSHLVFFQLKWDTLQCSAVQCSAVQCSAMIQSCIASLHADMQEGCLVFQTEGRLYCRHRCYHILLHYCSTVLYCTLLYSTVLFCTLLYSAVLCCTIMYSTILYSTVLYYIPLYYTQPYSTVQRSTILMHAALPSNYSTLLNAAHSTVLYRVCT